MIFAAIDMDNALELVSEVSEGDLELHLGDGNTFADYLGDGVFVIDQVDLETEEAQSVVLTQADAEGLLSSDAPVVDLSAPGTVGHSMGCGIFIIDQAPQDTPVPQRIVLTRADLALLLAWKA